MSDRDEVAGGMDGDFQYGLDFIARHRDRLLALTAGPTEYAVVEQTINVLTGQARQGSMVTDAMVKAALTAAQDYEDEHRKVKMSMTAYTALLAGSMRAALIAALENQP